MSAMPHQVGPDQVRTVKIKVTTATSKMRVARASMEREPLEQQSD